MTPTQQKQFNRMLEALRRIANEYQTPQQLKKGGAESFGLEPSEAIEMAYENIQEDAKAAVKGVRAA